MGFSPLVSMTKINVISGKISLSAELMASMIKRSGEYDYKIVKHDDSECSIQFYRKSEKGYLSTFTIEDAKKAGLMKGGSGWEKYPRAMLFSRALSQGARIECPHLLNGAYTAEEMGAEVNEEGEVISIETVTESPKQQEPQAKQSDVDAVIALAAELKDDLSEEIKAALRKAIHAGMTEQVCAGWKATLEKIKADGNGRKKEKQLKQEAEEPKPKPEITDPKLSDPMIPAQRVGMQRLLEQIKDAALKSEWQKKVGAVKTRQEAVEMIMQLNRVAHPKNGNGKADADKQDFIDKATWFRTWLKQRDKESEFLTVLGGTGCEEIEEVRVQDRKAFLKCLEGMYEDIMAREMKEKKEKTADVTE